jgi:hypothetical protein
MKTNFWLLSLTFIPFAIFGFLFSRFANFQKNSSDNALTIVSTLGVNFQKDILFITIDKDNKPYPQLVSIWGLFFSTKNQKAAEFIPIYPSINPLKDAVLLSKFFCIEDNRLDEKFLELINQAYQIKWDAFVMIDLKQLEEIINYLKVVGLVPEERQNTSSNSIEQQFLLQLCSLLKSTKRDLSFQYILHTFILDHNINSVSVSAFIKWMDLEQSFISCEVQE